MIDLLLDWALGPHCEVCGQRVFPKDRVPHEGTNHPGETAVTESPR